MLSQYLTYIFCLLCLSFNTAQADFLSSLPIKSTDTIYLPNVNRYILATDQLLTPELEYKKNIQAALAPIVKAAKQARAVNIYAFSDDASTRSLATQVTQEQAQRIADFLWSQGIELEQLHVRGMGNSESRISNTNNVLQTAFNRRIEIDLVL